MFIDAPTVLVVTYELRFVELVFDTYSYFWCYHLTPGQLFVNHITIIPREELARENILSDNILGLLYFTDIILQSALDKFNGVKVLSILFLILAQ